MTRSMKKRKGLKIIAGAEGKKIHILAVLITGLLFSMMTAMMCVSGSISFDDFLEMGKIYEWSQEELQSSSKKWIYEEENACFRIISQKAANKFTLDGQENAWNYLYVDIEKLSVPQLEAELWYYNKAGDRIYQQPVTLIAGENLIPLNGDIPVYKLLLCLYDAEGATFSLASMQAREAFIAFPIIKMLGAAAVAFLLFTMFTMAIFRLAGRKGQKKKHRLLRLLFAIYDFLGQLFEKSFGKCFTQKSGKVRETIQRFLFCLLILWTITGNVWGWLADKQEYRYHLLGCGVLLILLGLSCREEKEKRTVWTSPTAYAWLLLWIGMGISEFVVQSEFHFQGYIMIFAGGFFIYRWRLLKRPERLFPLLLEALEIVFFVSIFLCFLLRPKLPAIQYNGIFKSPGESAAFSLLLLVIFGIELERQVLLEKRGEKLCYYLSGMGLAVYLVLRAEDRTGLIALGLLFLIFVYRFAIYWKSWRKWLGRNSRGVLLAIGISCIVVLIFYAGTKVIPGKLGYALEYEDEQKLSHKSEQLLQDLEVYAPGATEGIVREAEIEKAVIQKHYIYHLNLFGNSGELKVFRKQVPAYSGYLYMAYRYGIFILVPYIMYQLLLMKIGLGCLSGIRRPVGSVTETWKEQAGIWLLGITVIYICYSIGGDIEVFLGHPLWLCVYLAGGYWFAGPSVDTVKKN